MELIILIISAFITSSISAVLGMGGGIILLGIIIFVARFPAHLSNLEFSQNINDKKVKWHRDYVSVGKYNNLQNSFRNEVLNLSKNNLLVLY